MNWLILYNHSLILANYRIRKSYDIIKGMATVKIYSTPTCPWCKKAKAYLDEKGIAFEGVDVSSDANAQKEMIDKSGQMGVPVLDIDGKIVIGFDKEKIDEILNLNK